MSFVGMFFLPWFALLCLVSCAPGVSGLLLQFILVLLHLLVVLLCLVFRVSCSVWSSLVFPPHHLLLFCSLFTVLLLLSPLCCRLTVTGVGAGCGGQGS